MRSTSRILVILALIFAAGCDAPDERDTQEVAELEALESPGDLAATPEPGELETYGWTEAPAEHSEVTDLTPPPSKGTCGGYWESSGYADFQGCGTCTHTLPEPDRDGNLAYWYRRWCWTGGWGCTGCEPWILNSTQCYDNCG